jgi:hypothetical protein
LIYQWFPSVLMGCLRSRNLGRSSLGPDRFR